MEARRVSDGYRLLRQLVPMRILIVVAVMAIAASSVLADTIRLKNGNTFEGKIEERTDKKLTVKIPEMGRLTFDASEIASIAVSQSPQASAAQQAPSAVPAEELSAEDEPAQYEETYDEQGGSADRKQYERDSHEVIAMGVRLELQDGIYGAEVTFRDKNHKPCATSGRLVVSREVTEYKKDFKVECTTCFAEEVKIPVKKEQTVRSVNFKPDDFDGYENKSVHLPVQFRPGEIEPEDTLYFEWRSFKVKEFAPGDRES